MHKRWLITKQIDRSTPTLNGVLVNNETSRRRVHRL